MKYTFNQSGCIPGVPGTFAGVIVDVDDATNTVLSVTSIARHPEFVPAPKEEAPTKAKKAKPAPDEQPAEAAPDIAIEAVPVEAAPDAPVEPVAAQTAQKESA